MRRNPEVQAYPRPQGRRFTFWVAWFLMVTGSLKLISALLETKVLGASDPLLPLFTERQVIFAAAVLELGVAYALLRHRHAIWAPWLVLWLVGVFAAYRLGLRAIGFHGHCSCLGHLFDWFPGFTAWSDRTLLTSLFVMGFGSLLLLLRPHWTSPRKAFPRSAGNLLLVSIPFASALNVTAPLLAGDDATPPLLIRAVVTAHALSPDGAQVLFSSVTPVVVCSSNGWWRVVRLSTNDENIVQDCMRIPDGIRLSAPSTLPTHGTTNPLPIAVTQRLRYPPPMSDGLFAAWLAFCPRPELPLLDTHHMRRFLAAEVQEDPANRGTFAVEYIPPGHAFLAALSITNNGVLFGPGGTKINVQSPFSQGYLELQYELERVTNFHGIALPAEAVLRYFAPRPKAKASTDLYEFRTDKISLLQVEALNAATLPTSEPIVIAIDQRPMGLPTNTSITYVVTNDSWRPTTNEDLMSLVRIKQLQQRGPRPKGTLYATILLVLLIVPPILFLMWRRQIRNLKETQ